jgi:hypothetical protein
MDVSDFAFVVRPGTRGELAQFYILWVLLYFIVHLVWDIVSSHTAPFEFRHLGNKLGVVFSGTTFATSLALLLGTMDPGLFKLLGSTTLPIVVAAYCGILVSVSQLSPVKR